MKKLLLVLSFLALAALPIYSRNPSPSPRVKPARPLVATVSGIRDKTKETVMNRINAQMNKVNENLTNMWQRLIDRMQELAGKLQTRLDAMAADGKDTAAANAALDEADTALSAAAGAV